MMVMCYDIVTVIIDHGGRRLGLPNELLHMQQDNNRPEE